MKMASAYPESVGVVTNMPLEFCQDLAFPDAGAASVRIFGSERLPLNDEERAGLERLTSLPGVVQVVALPDLHIKPKLETPSSTASALREGVILSLSSPSPGCGMALALLPIGLEDLSEGRLDQYINFLTLRLAINRSTGTGAGLNMQSILAYGAKPVLDRFGLEPELARRFEERGNALEARSLTSGRRDALESVPDFLMPLAKQEFGQVGGGNHFLEMQVVERVLDVNVAARWGIQPGQAVVMMHADSGRFGAFIGRLYAHRQKNTPRGRLVEMRYKVPFHLQQARSPYEAWRRLGTYIWPRRYTFLPAGSLEAEQALQALALATNYAYANRAAVLAALRDGLQATWGAAGELGLLYDSIHNSIRPEVLNGERVWIHRHNASRALPANHSDLVGSPFYETGQPLLLPGTDQTHSYLCVAGPGTEHSLYSVDHGAGRSARRLGIERKDGSYTRLYSYRGGFLKKQPHWTDDGVDEVLRVLSATGLACPVARLRPIAVLKDVAG